jgi:REP element-mobilizing transposase RayT
MGRRPRTDYPGAIHHVMNRGVDRQPVFNADADRIDFGRQLAVIHERHGIDVLAYCLMGNHYHLLVRSPGGNLAAAMHYLGIAYTRHANDRIGRDGPLFRGRYHALLVETDPYLRWVARYIHRNPLDLPSVDAPDRYRWSSYRTYLGHRRVPPFLDTTTILAMFGHDVAALARFTSDELVPAGQWSYPDLRQLIGFTIADDDLRFSSDATRRRLDRTVTLLIVQHLGDEQVWSALRDDLRFPSLGAERTALRRAQERSTEPVVERIVQRLLRTISPIDQAA